VRDISFLGGDKSSLDLWWTKWRWGRFSPSTSVFPANLHSTNFSTITLTYHPGLVQYSSSGRSTQSPTAQIKKKKIDRHSVRIAQSISPNKNRAKVKTLKEQHAVNQGSRQGPWNFYFLDDIALYNLENGF
jgi:hypothetical protein